MHNKLANILYSKNVINVTRTYLPNKERYLYYLDRIYENGWVTNNGPLVQELERKLADYLGVKNLILVANGTLGLEIAYRVLEIKNFVVTTPFSFVATVSSLVANGLHPIFADINPNTFNIEPANIKQSITRNTTAILGVHVFGNSCEIDEIQQIANEYGIKVIYDAAHAFGVKYKNKSILTYGDVSVISFHATKLFHTVEGGAVIVNNDDLVEKARYLINFGIKNTDEIPELGINAKMNEFEAAMGLCVLEDIDKILEKRKSIYNTYYDELKEFLQFQQLNPNATYNYSYCPVVFESEDVLLKVLRKLNERNIYPRRYFYPSLDTLNYIEPKQYMPISRDISKRILCLPTFFELKEEEQELIIKTIKEVING